MTINKPNKNTQDRRKCRGNYQISVLFSVDYILFKMINFFFWN